MEGCAIVDSELGGGGRHQAEDRKSEIDVVR